MTKTPQWDIRSAAERHGEYILKLTHEAFPFEGDKSGGEPLLEIKRLIREGRKIGHFVYVVGLGKKDKLCGFAAVRPHVAGNGRTSRAVCYVPQVVVDPTSRRMGLGPRLISRALEVGKTLGYTHAIASIPASLEDWYRHQQWNVAKKGNLYAWIEDPHPGDDNLWPGLSPVPPEYRGKYTPLQSQEPGPDEHGYDRIAYTTMAEKGWFVDIDHPGGPEDSARHIFHKALKDPYILTKMPPLTAAALLLEMQTTNRATSEEMSQYRKLLELIAPASHRPIGTGQ